MENNESLTVISAWKNFTILDCVKHIALSYTAIKQTTLNSCWKKLWPNVVKNEHSISTLNDEYSQIVQMAHLLGGESFDDFTEDDIAELMTDKELSEDDLVNLVCESESDKSDEDELVPVTFTAKVIREGLALGRKLGNHFIQNDTNVERALRFQRDINRCLAQYEEVYKDLTKNSKQLLITDFITNSHNVNISASNIESAQITSSDESEFEPSIPKKRMRVISDSDEG
nr:tigger transposable element-derived protein 1-like [Onthophagus taurus]